MSLSAELLRLTTGTCGSHISVPRSMVVEAARCLQGNADVARFDASATAEMLHAGQRRPLSIREHEVATLICAGESSKTIAVRLGIAVKTAEKHRENALRAVGARNTAHLAHLYTARHPDVTARIAGATLP